MDNNQAAEQPSAEDSPALSPEERFAEKLFGSEQPEDEEGQEQAASESDEQAADAEGEQTPQAETELVEVEFSGKQYKLPPELKDALMAQSDYTRKTQEVAERQRLVDLQMMQMQHEANFQQSVRQEFNDLAQLEYEISRYKNVDWSSLDTDTYIRTKSVLDTLKEQKSDVEKKIDAKRNEYGQGLQQLMEQAKQKGNEYLSRVIPKWGPETGKELATYGTQEGYSDVEIGSLTDARMVKTLWKAMQWDKLQSQKASTTKRANQAPPVAKPGASKANQAQSAQDANYRKQLRSAKSSSAKARLIQERIADKWIGPA
jgi:hypothetical protein